MKTKSRRDRRRSDAQADDIPSDVSELEGWRAARHRVEVAKAKIPTRRVTINLDEDIIAVFKAEALAGGAPYQVAINQALRAYLRGRELSAREHAVRAVLTALDDEAVRKKLRSIG